MLNHKITCFSVFSYFLIFGFLNFVFAQAVFKYDPKGKRNPFIPLVTRDGKLLKLDTSEEGNKGFTLEGIIYDKNGVSYAIFNGSVVKTGDTVGDFQILKIMNNKIVIIKEGQASEIELNKGEE
ncbi:MAG: hypothetical protein V1699_05775 [Candidatus Omnitrophota bacterium]